MVQAVQVGSRQLRAEGTAEQQAAQVPPLPEPQVAQAELRASLASQSQLAVQQQVALPEAASQELRPRPAA